MNREAQALNKKQSKITKLRQQIAEMSAPKVKKKTLRVPADEVSLYLEAINRIKAEREKSMQKQHDELVRNNYEAVQLEMEKEEIKDGTS